MEKLNPRKLSVFLSYASEDKKEAIKLYKRLKRYNIHVWQDKEELLPGQNWNEEIEYSLDTCDLSILLMSKTSVAKEGYIQKEFNTVLEKAKEKPQGIIYLIPAKIDDCTIPTRFSKFQSVDLTRKNGFEKLLLSLSKRVQSLKNKNVMPLKTSGERKRINKDKGIAMKSLKIEDANFSKVGKSLNKLSAHELSLIYTVLFPHEDKMPVKKEKLLEGINQVIESNSNSLVILEKVASAFEMKSLLENLPNHTKQ